MKKVTMVSLLFVNTLLFAQNDANSSLSPEQKMIYMPDIVAKGDDKSGFYAGFGLANGILNFQKESGNEVKNKILDLAVVAGYYINDYLDAEGRVNLSVAYEDGIDYHSWGLFLKPKYEVYKGIDLYSLIGYGRFKASGIFSNGTHMEHSGIQWGVGTDYRLKDNFKIFADYLYMGKDKAARLNNQKGSAKSSAFTAGISYDF